MQRRMMLVLFLGVLMAALDVAIVGPALPAIQTAFGVGDRLLPWLFTIYVLTNLVGTPLMAKLSDRLGRRSAYLAAVGLFALGSLVVVLSPSFGVMLVGRAIQGFGAGGIFPVASAVIGDTFPADQRGRALGLIGAVWGLAFIIGPILGGLLLLLSWHWLFAINIPIALAVVAAGAAILPSTRPAEPPRFDWRGMATLAVLLTSLAYGLNQIDAAHLGQSLTSPGVWPFLALGLALIPLLAVVERRAADPIIQPQLFASRQLRLANALSFGAGMGEVGVLFLPALAVASFAVSEARASFMVLPLVVALALGSPPAGRLLDAVGSRLVILAGTSLLAAGMLTLWRVSGTQVGFYAGSILIGFGLSSLLGAPLRYIMINETPAENRAASQALLTIFTSVGQLVSAALIGAVAASAEGRVAGYTQAYLAIGLLALLLVALAARLKGHSAELATLQPQAERVTAP
ncbi:MAG: MFS transporter [Caldilineaceae bacterium]|nr:MFS transporter [Caldilineaceae bacterium]